MIEGFQIKRILVDSNYHHNILFSSALEKKRHEWDRIEGPTELVLMQEGPPNHVIGKIILTVALRKWAESTSQKMLFLIVPSPYNGILGMPFQDHFCLFLSEGAMALDFIAFPNVGYMH